jgi:DNA modification methylase
MPWSSETFHGGKKDAHERRVKTVPAGLKPKDLVGILWRVAFALQDDGWWLLRDNVWSKPNPMPESTTDRCTSAHEYVFQLTKSARYYFDHEAIKEPAVPQQRTGKLGGHSGPSDIALAATGKRHGMTGLNGPSGDKRHKRSVWTIATSPFPGAHFATYPPAPGRRQGRL